LRFAGVRGGGKAREGPETKRNETRNNNNKLSQNATKKQLNC
jgi:hypothetical protein